MVASAPIRLRTLHGGVTLWEMLDYQRCIAPGVCGNKVTSSGTRANTEHATHYTHTHCTHTSHTHAKNTITLKHTLSLHP